MSRLVVGFDPGNSEATLVLAPGGRGKSLTIPSFIGSGSLSELARIRSGAGADALDRGEYVLDCEGRGQFVGRLALEQARDASSARGDTTRYWSGHALRLLMVLAGAMIKVPRFSARVITGLPVQVWSRETVRRVQQSLVGTHTYRLNGVERTMSVEGVLVMMEGAGALAAYGSQENIPQAVIDVGGRTTDLFWSEGQKPTISRCSGLPVGIEKAGDVLRQQFHERYGRDLSAREVGAILRGYAGSQEMPQLYADGRALHLNGEVDSAITSVAAEIASFVAQAWASGERGRVASEAARVLLIGGGAYYVADALRRLIPHLEVPKQPELANAQGYLAVGAHVPEDRWESLK